MPRIPHAAKRKWIKRLAWYEHLLGKRKFADAEEFKARFRRQEKWL